MIFNIFNSILVFLITLSGGSSSRHFYVLLIVVLILFTELKERFARTHPCKQANEQHNVKHPEAKHFVVAIFHCRFLAAVIGLVLKIKIVVKQQRCVRYYQQGNVRACILKSIKTFFLLIIGLGGKECQNSEEAYKHCAIAEGNANCVWLTKYTCASHQKHCNHV